MTTIPTPQALLARAADIIGERGWAQGDYINEAGCVCAVGAIRAAAAEQAGLDNFLDVLDGDAVLPVGLSDAARRAELLAGDRLVANDDGSHVGGILFGGLVGWNDAEGRTADEVVTILRAAAEGGEER